MDEDLNKLPGGSTRKTLGYVGLGLAILGAVAILAGLPWQIRLPLVVIAVLFGPGVPLMLWLSQLPAVKSVVAGVGLDVSLLLLVGEAMVLLHVWQPDVVVTALLVLSAIASARLLTELPILRDRADHA